MRTRITESGWTAEFAIPFRTLRFPGGRRPDLGRQLPAQHPPPQRARVLGARFPRQYNLVSRRRWPGPLAGLQTPAVRNLKVTPYVLGNVIESGVAPVDADLFGDVGVDVKYSLTPSLTLDGTVNTDFAQVEVDDQQVNLDRFNLFFPEKRPFFLENAGFFTVGNPGEVELFFSRRSGFGIDGSPIGRRGDADPRRRPAVGQGGQVQRRAAQHADRRLQGHRSPATTSPWSASAASCRIARRSACSSSTARASAISRPIDDYNRTYAVDGKLGIRQDTVVSGFLSATETPGVESDDHAYNLRRAPTCPRFDLELGYQEVGEQFNPEVGFLTRRGYRKPDARIMTRWRPKDFLKLQEIRPHASYRGFWGFDDFHETSYWHLDSHWQFRNSAEVHTGMNLTGKACGRRSRSTPASSCRPGTYEHAEAQLVFMTNQGAPVSLNVTAPSADSSAAIASRSRPTLRMRAGETFTTELAYQRNDVDLPWATSRPTWCAPRVSYSFTPRTFVQGLVQYNDRADLWSMNLRFGWLQAANTGLFVVYTDTRGLYDLYPTPAADRPVVRRQVLADVRSHGSD